MIIKLEWDMVLFIGVENIFWLVDIMENFLEILLKLELQPQEFLGIVLVLFIIFIIFKISYYNLIFF